MKRNKTPSNLLTTSEAAEFLGMSPAFLERDRCEGPTIPFVRVGNHRVRYRLAELEAYIAKRRSTAVRKKRPILHLRKRRWP